MKFYTAPQVLSSAPVTFILALLVLFFSLTSFFNKNFFYKMVLHPYDVVHNRKYYRLFTSDFVHIDLQHFFVNVVSLVFFCGDLERHLRRASRFGSLFFMIIFLVSLLTGNLIMTYRHRNDIAFSSAGASGSILGCLFGFMYLEPNKVAFYAPVIGAVNNEYYALIYLVLMIVLRRRIAKTGASYELHFWGTIGGIIATVFITMTW